MNAPIADFLDRYAESGSIRLHMPGHKGAHGAERFDITEIPGADSLYESDGIISQSESNASSLFGSFYTAYSTEGSSLCIRAMTGMVLTYALENRLPRRILAGRNAHKSFITAAGLLGFEVDWILPESGELIYGNASPDGIRRRLESGEYAAVYITSPDYSGGMADIKGISAVCKEKKVLLAVDNAHGAYLKFAGEGLHPLSAGADVCCDSAHKTLPVLTGGAYLHVSHSAPKELKNAHAVKNAMSTFGSTSPSYLILRSLDECNLALANGYGAKIIKCCEQVKELKLKLNEAGFETVGDEPMKISLAPKSYGYTGKEVDSFLRKRGIYCDFAEPDRVIFMPTPNNGGEDLKKLCSALASLPRRAPVQSRPPFIKMNLSAVPIGAALFAPFERIDVRDCVGRICAGTSVSCPPAVPIAVCGEVMDASTLAAFEYYGIKECDVLKEQ